MKKIFHAIGTTTCTTVLSIVTFISCMAVYVLSALNVHEKEEYNLDASIPVSEFLSGDETFQDVLVFSPFIFLIVSIIAFLMKRRFVGYITVLIPLVFTLPLTVFLCMEYDLVMEHISEDMLKGLLGVEATVQK